MKEICKEFISDKDCLYCASLIDLIERLIADIEYSNMHKDTAHPIEYNTYKNAVKAIKENLT